MNNVNLIGRLTADPVLRHTDQGTPVCSYYIAVRRPMLKDTTDFPECVSWRQTAEFLSRHARKGDLIGVTGTLQSRKWTDRDGKNHTAWEVSTTNVEILSKRNFEESTDTDHIQNETHGQNRYEQQSFQPVDEPDGELPF